METKLCNIFKIANAIKTFTKTIQESLYEDLKNSKKEQSLNDPYNFQR